jgi:electron transfer flavoprotein beta subunit
MKVMVAVKRVVDYAVKVRVDKSGTGVDLSSVKMSMNPFCEIAVEEAVKLKEKKVAEEVIAVSIGPKQSQETLRTALAMGADKGIHVPTEARTDSDVQPLAVAKLLSNIAKKEGVDVIVMGKQSIDGDNCQTGPMTAALLGWSQCTFASAVSIEGQTGTVDRETDAGSEKLNITIPCVITADLRLNEPRYATLPNIMKAKKKPIDTMTPEDLGVDMEPKNVILNVSEPPVRKAGIAVDDVDTLIEKLKNEAAVI